MTNELIQQLKARITQLERERDEWTKQAQLEIANKVGQFNGAIAELQVLVDDLERGNEGEGIPAEDVEENDDD